ncbi:MAG: pirin [Cellvibrionaceae bacterium]|nr:pirin [Cellvibrionaceae bacterium]
MTFKEKDYSGSMDPLVMVDHYRMTEPTFGAHPHAGLSAVSVLFEDSEGKFHNRDSLGNDFDLMPGDLYWLKAGSGVIHDESPRQGAKIHGLQVFVNLPSADKKIQPSSLHIKAQDMPVYDEHGSRIRIVLGESNGIYGQQAPALPMTILDGRIDSRSGFAHQLNGGESAWLYVIKGELKLTISGQKINLLAGQSIAISSFDEASFNTLRLFNSGNEQAHFTLFAGKPIAEAFVQKGPFVMNTEAEIAQVEADFAAGKLGHLK